MKTITCRLSQREDAAVQRPAPLHQTIPTSQPRLLTAKSDRLDAIAEDCGSYSLSFQRYLSLVVAEPPFPRETIPQAGPPRLTSAAALS